eukprot:gene6663-3328_t
MAATAACGTAWAACYAAAGLVAGTVTAGIGAPAAALACNAAEGNCMALCFIPAAAEAPLTGGASLACAGLASCAGIGAGYTGYVVYQRSMKQNSVVECVVDKCEAALSDKILRACVAIAAFYFIFRCCPCRCDTTVSKFDT